MGRYKLIFGTLLLALAVATGGFAQDKKQLEANKKKLEQEIAQTNKQLSQTQKKQKATLAQLDLVNSNIKKRKQLIDGLNQEVKITDREINKLQTKINRLSSDIDNLKKEYARLTVSAYKHRNRFSTLMFILSSQSFNQAARRIRYISQYNDYINKQVQIISEKQTVLESSRKTLEKEKESKKKLVNEQETERKKLQKEQQQQSKIVSQLKSRESELKKKLQKQQKKVDQLNAQIHKAINEEIKRSQEEARKKGQSTGGGFALTPEQKQLSENFAANKGKLPWPVEKGVISGTFGTHPHPVLPNLTKTNNGIDILTEKHAAARAVFKGKVVGVNSVSGLKYIMVQHGEYTTVYANLDQVYVKTGDQVSTKQKLGRIYYDSDEDKCELQFLLWKGNTKIDPQPWIAK